MIVIRCTYVRPYVLRCVFVPPLCSIDLCVFVFSFQIIINMMIFHTKIKFQNRLNTASCPKKIIFKKSRDNMVQFTLKGYFLMYQTTYIIVIFPFFEGLGKSIFFHFWNLDSFEEKIFWYPTILYSLTRMYSQPVSE